MSDQFSFDDSELHVVWRNVLARLATEVHESHVNKYLKPLEPVSLDGNVVRLAAPGKFMQEWVRERFAGMLQSFISDELGYSVELEIVARPREKRELEEPTTVVATPQVVSQSTAFEPNPSFNFENFIVGDTNRLAFAGAKAVASEPGGTYKTKRVGEDALVACHRH